MSDTDTYIKTTESIWTEYQPRVIALTEKIADLIAEAIGGARNGSFDLSADDYQWAATVSHPDVDGRPVIDVTLELSESLTHEESTEGWNWYMGIATYEGRMLGGGSPYNYTPEVWTADRGQISDRLGMLEDAAGELADEAASAYLELESEER